MLTISIMRENDIQFVMECINKVNWGHLEIDIKRLIDFEPEGCFIIWQDKQRVGMVTTTSYENYAFLGCLIVKEEERGKGIGASIMKYAMNNLIMRGVKTIELDGVFSAVSLYRRLGFQDKYLSLRLFREKGEIVEREESEKTKSENQVLNYNSAMLEEIISFDKEKTNILRERAIKRFLIEFEDSTYVIKDKKILAYAIVRPRCDYKGIEYFTIGPLIAENKEFAEMLISYIVNEYKENLLTIGIPAINKDMLNILLKYDFKYKEPSLRMYFGEKKTYEKYVYGILSAEKG